MCIVPQLGKICKKESVALLPLKPLLRLLLRPLGLLLLATSLYVLLSTLRVEQSSDWPTSHPAATRRPLLWAAAVAAAAAAAAVSSNRKRWTRRYKDRCLCATHNPLNIRRIAYLKISREGQRLYQQRRRKRQQWQQQQHLQQSVAHNPDVGPLKPEFRS